MYSPPTYLPPANAVTTTPSLPSIPPTKSLPLKGPRSDISHTFGPSIHVEQTILRYITEAARDFPPFSGIAPTGTTSQWVQRLHTIDAYAHQIAEINCYKHGRSMLEARSAHSAFLTAVTDRLTPGIRSPRIPPAVQTQ
ncbi:hypothetical protein DYB36_012724 [Aphanomyces astaci]|uniref:Uncharacterized protein n=1 Tax=Aphanomyces astaci TaxID=112090 RepID=A0A397ARF1_APHAT|nr:hypothetical protein DYB36_012724 [Aphanomyces astaci]